MPAVDGDVPTCGDTMDLENTIDEVVLGDGCGENVPPAPAPQAVCAPKASEVPAAVPRSQPGAPVLREVQPSGAL
jgi:hypothetical protein